MENLGIDFKLLVAQIINFGLFYLIYKKYISKPFIELVKEEEINEKNKVKIVDQVKKQEEELIKKNDEFRESMLIKEQEITDDIKNKTKLIKRQIIQNAEIEAEKIRSKAKKEIEAEKIELYKEIKQNVIKTSIVVINKVLEDVVDEDLKKKYTNSVLKNLSKNSKNYEN